VNTLSRQRADSTGAFDPAGTYGVIRPFRDLLTGFEFHVGTLVDCRLVPAPLLAPSYRGQVGGVSEELIPMAAMRLFARMLTKSGAPPQVLAPPLTASARPEPEGVLTKNSRLAEERLRALGPCRRVIGGFDLGRDRHGDRQAYATASSSTSAVPPPPPYRRTCWTARCQTGRPHCTHSTCAKWRRSSTLSLQNGSVASLLVT